MFSHGRSTYFYSYRLHTKMELLLRVELRTSSLPRMRSTTELKQQKLLSGKRDSNPRPPAWKASALSTELFPQKTRLCFLRESLLCRIAKASFYSSCKRLPRLNTFVGADGFEPPKSRDSRFTVCPIWPLWNTPMIQRSLEPLVGLEPTTAGLQI